MNRFVFLSGLILLVFLASLSLAGIPRLINYQGMLTQTDGTPLDGTPDLTFKIYGSLSGDDSLWWEYHSGVTVTNGLFNVMLGSISPIPDSVFADSLRYLGITVGADLELSPRVRLTSVGYAYRSLVADSAVVAVSAPTGGGWTDDGTTVRLTTDTDSVGIGTDDPAAKLNVVGGAFWVLTGGFGGSGCRIDGNEITGTGVNPPGSNPLHIKPGDNSSHLLLAEDGGNIGIGIDDPQNKLHIHNPSGTEISYAQFTNPTTGTQPSDGFFVGINSSGNAFISNHESRSLTIRTNNTDRIHIKSDGNVGIGTTNPSNILHIGGGGQTPSQAYDGIYVNPAQPQVWVSVEDTTGVEGGIMSHQNGTVYIGSWSNHPVRLRTNNSDQVLIDILGNVGIGTTNPNYKLDVNGDINVSGNVRKGGGAYNYPDYVFEPTYNLMPIDELKEYVFEKKSLPNVMSVEDVKKNNGFNMDELLIQMLEKIEEQTLYIFQLEERVAELEKRQR